MSTAGERKQPITLAMIAGLLKSAAIINEHFNTRLKQEATEPDSVMRPPTEEEKNALQLPNGVSALGVNLTEGYSGNYSIGMFQSVQVLVGLAAELALKFAYEQENANVRAPNKHDLFDLYHKLSNERRSKIETDYLVRLRRRETAPAATWQTAEGAFKAARNHFVNWRYASEGKPIGYFQPVILIEAICSLCKTLGMNISLGNST